MRVLRPNHESFPILNRKANSCINIIEHVIKKLNLHIERFRPMGIVSVRVRKAVKMRMFIIL
jgi:hypothetical protein